MPQINKPCLLPFESPEIRSSGDVVLCCNDMYSDVVMGNIASQRLEEIWGSDGRRGLKLCEACNHDGGNCNYKFPLEDFEWVPRPVRKAVYRYTPAPVKKLIKKIGNI